MRQFAVVGLAAMLAACGGGGGGGGGAGAGGASLSGVVAGGAPMSDGAVAYVLDAATGTKTAFLINSDGSYTVSLSGQTGPFLIHAKGLTTGGSVLDLYSLASSTNLNGKVNVTPLSDTIVGYAAGKRADELEAACTSALSACPALFNGIIANLSQANANILAALPASVKTQFGITSSTNFLTTTFTADHTGLDGLLDTLQITPPPAGGGGTYTINLNGGTPTTLATVPVSSNATATAPTVVTSTLSPNQLAQAANLALALAQAKAQILDPLNAMFATSLPTNTQLAAILDASYKNDGANKATAVTTMLANFPVGTKFMGGALAPYNMGPQSGAPDAITYDANNCVTSMWVYSGYNGLVNDSALLKNTGTSAACTGGIWTHAGNQRAYTSRIASIFLKLSPHGVSPIYRSGLNFRTLRYQTTSSVPTPYAYVTVSGPGITTKGNSGGTGGSITLIPGSVWAPNLKTANSINDPYYGSTSTTNPYYPGALEGDNQLIDCTQLTIGTPSGNWGQAPTSSTPCLNSSAQLAGGDYTISFYDTGNNLLETNKQRLEFAPGTIDNTWYPTITSVTPAGSTLPTTGGTVTVNWTMPAEAKSIEAFLNINDPNITTLMNVTRGVARTASTAQIVVPALPSHAGSPNAPGPYSSYAFITTVIGGVIVVNAIDY